MLQLTNLASLLLLPLLPSSKPAQAAPTSTEEGVPAGAKQGSSPAAPASVQELELLQGIDGLSTAHQELGSDKEALLSRPS